MNPLSPKQILRSLENGYFMTHQEQSETAQYIRELQQAVLSEREACAQVCEDGLPMGMGQTIGPMMCAAAIRARSMPE